MTLNTQEVLALAPDSSSQSAAKGLVNPSKWPLLGESERAVWGECQGSGSKPYRTQVDQSGSSPSFKCSCPSRKFPCKHGLALLLMRASSSAAFSSQEPPWVEEWFKGRVERAEKKEAKAATPFDPAAAQKKEDARWKKIEDGAQELDRFLCDRVDRGLANLAGADLSDWHAMSARMVDAQAPALGESLSELANAVSRSQDWPLKLLLGMGRLHLMTEGVKFRDRLSEDMRFDLRLALGWPITSEQVIKTGRRKSGAWRVLGQVKEQKPSAIVERRVWLQSETGESAVLIDYMAGSRGFETAWITGTSFEAELVFYPGSLSLRALVHGEVSKSNEFEPISDELTHALKKSSQAFGLNPWVQALPMFLSDVVPKQDGEKWKLESQTGLSFEAKMQNDTGLRAMALSGGDSCSVMGEWNGTCIRPLTVFLGSVAHSLEVGE